MKYIIIISALLLTGCSHLRYMQNNPDIACKFCNETRKDTIYSTDTILIGAPELIYTDTLWIVPEVDEYSFSVFSDSITGDITHESTKGSTTTISKQNGRLYVKTICKDDSLKQVIKTYRQLITKLESENRIITIEKPPLIITKTAWYYWVLLGAVACVMFFIGARLFRNKQ